MLRFLTFYTQRATRVAYTKSAFMLQSHFHFAANFQGILMLKDVNEDTIVFAIKYIFDWLVFHICLSYENFEKKVVVVMILVSSKMAESVNNESERNSDPVSVNSAEPENVKILNSLPMIFSRKVKMKIMSFMGFMTMIQSDRYLVTWMMKLNLLKVSMCILPCQTSLKTAGRWTCLQPLTDT